MAISDDVVSIFKIKIKPRQDTYSDQFSRIFLLKVMTVAALFTGAAWYSGSINCLVPDGNADGDFIGTACWINGIYVYEEIRYHNNDIGYYGIPRTINNDGMYKNGELCSTGVDGPKAARDKNCKPMMKTFFLQYQYMTLFLSALAVLYYAPYSIFKYVNSDLAALKSSLKDGNGSDITKNFFNRGINSSTKMNWRILGNIIIKLLYIISNILAFLLMDMVLNGRFRTYGTEWNKWAKLNNSMAYDYMGKRHSPKPGNVLLPSFVLCDVHELAQDIKHTLINKHHVICEMNEHILYQYILAIAWFMMVLGMVVSVIGFIMLFVNYGLVWYDTRPLGVHTKLSLRECEYLDYVRRKNMPVFGEVLKKLRGQRQDGLLENEDGKGDTKY